MDIEPSYAISEIEKLRLKSLEDIIERGIQTFKEVGDALAEIRDRKLYLLTHSTFEEYAQGRWDFTRQRAYQLIEAAHVVANLESTTVVKPSGERQVRPLVGLEPDAQKVVWSVVEQTAPDGRVTSDHVRSVVNVFREVVVTQAIDDGTGEQIAVSDVAKAVITEETFERMMRQMEYIKQATDRKKRRYIVKSAVVPVVSAMEGTIILGPLIAPEMGAVGEGELVNVTIWTGGDDE